MYKIGAFSKITGLTVKALRYYHDEGLLIPKHIDDITGYRMYDKDQIDQGIAINRLRDCTFSIKEIKEIIADFESLEDLPYYMDEKIDVINQEMASLRKVKEKLISESRKQKEVKQMNDYQVNEKTIDTVLVLAVRYKGRYDECGHYMGELFKQAKGQNKNCAFNIYYDEGYEEKADIQVCLPIKKEVSTKNDVKVLSLNEESGLSVIHVGPYDQLGGAYQAIEDYAKEKGYTLKVPAREYYLKGPGMMFKGNPNKYVTEIFIPYEV